MPHTEVLGLSIRQYAADGHKVLIPRIYGKTAAAAVAKGELPRLSYGELMNAAGPAAREVAVAQTEDWTTTTSQAARQLRAVSGRTLVSIYPAWGGIQLYLGDIEDSGMHRTHEQLLSRLAVLAGKPISRRQPIVGFDRLISVWPEFEGEWLSAYVDARAEALRAP